MFETFSNRYESVFRQFFNTWVIGWGVINFFNVIYRYSTFASQGNEATGVWFFDTLGSLLGLTLGIFLIAIMGGVPASIKKLKKVSSNNVIMILAVFYYILPTLLNIFGTAIFSSNKFVQEFPFIILWFFPSFVFLISHIFYCVNINKYNSELEEKEGSIKA